MRLNTNSNNSNNRSALAEPSDDDFEADENSNPSQNDTLSDKKSLIPGRGSAGIGRTHYIF